MTEPRIERCLSDGFLADSLRADARAGLTVSPKWLPPKWFYDERGSELFDKITLLDEVAAPPVSRTGHVASAVTRGLRSSRPAVLHCVPFRSARRPYQVTRKAQARTGIRPEHGGRSKGRPALTSGSRGHFVYPMAGHRPK